MNTWWYMLIYNLVIAVVILAGGWLMWKWCPQKMNHLIGYRTSRSMKNMDTWKFANEHGGKLWWKLGWTLLALTIVGHVMIWACSEDTQALVGGILIGIQLILLIVSIFPTEKALRCTFHDDGTRKQFQR